VIRAVLNAIEIEEEEVGAMGKESCFFRRERTHLNNIILNAELFCPAVDSGEFFTGEYQAEISGEIGVSGGDISDCFEEDMR